MGVGISPSALCNLLNNNGVFSNVVAGGPPVHVRRSSLTFVNVPDHSNSSIGYGRRRSKTFVASQIFCWYNLAKLPTWL